MTKQELEIKCKILEDRINRIYEICNQYPSEIDAGTAIGKIIANCDPKFLTDDIGRHI